MIIAAFICPELNGVAITRYTKGSLGLTFYPKKRGQDASNQTVGDRLKGVQESPVDAGVLFSSHA